jgi:integrase
MAKGQTDGSVFQDQYGRWVARKRYTNRKGEPKVKERIADPNSERAARKLLRAILQEIEDEANGLQLSGPTNKRRTFKDVAEWCKQNIFVDAEYRGLTKIKGLRSKRSVHGYLIPLTEYFGKMTFDLIEYDDIEKYREQRIHGITRYGQVRTVASVNRELSYLRRIFKIGLRKRWRRDNPFDYGEPLIHASLERKKCRIMTTAEEDKLMAKAALDYRCSRHLPFAIEMALQTAMRLSEQFRLTDDDIDLEAGIIMATSYKGKVAKRRPVPITDELMPKLKAYMESRESHEYYHECEKRRREKAGDAGDLLSPRLFYFDSPRSAFETARFKAKINDITWHDLRHTAITRMVHIDGMEPHDVMKISGHDNWSTFWNVYVNIDQATARAIGAKLNAARAKRREAETIETPASVLEAAASEAETIELESVN